MKILVLTSEPISAQQLRAALPGDVNPRATEVMVVAPALQDSPLKFWFSDADQAIARAAGVGRETARQLDQTGFHARADTGESDPTEAVQDALQTFNADRIVVFTRPGGDQRYREDVDPAELQDRFGVPVDSAPAA